MFDLLFFIVIGVLIGWQIPQPFWAVYSQNWIKTKWNDRKVN